MNRSSGHGHVLIRGGASLAEEKGRCQHPGFKLTVLKKGVRSKLAHCGTVRERWSFRAGSGQIKNRALRARKGVWTLLEI